MVEIVPMGFSRVGALFRVCLVLLFIHFFCTFQGYIENIIAVRKTLIICYNSGADEIKNKDENK